VILRINTLETALMPIPQPTPEGSVLVAIDISKLRNDVLIEIPGKTRRLRLTVLNSRTEHDRFLERLTRFDRPVIIGFEATGKLPPATGLPAYRGWFHVQAYLVAGTRPHM
jgi:hypothetical protein